MLQYTPVPALLTPPVVAGSVQVAGTVVSVVGSTIRLSLQRRRIEVQVLKAVGIFNL